MPKTARNRFDTPWEFETDYCTDAGASCGVVDSQGETVAEADHHSEQLEHAVRCVNAMEGIESPAVFVTQAHLNRANLNELVEIHATDSLKCQALVEAAYRIPGPLLLLKAPKLAQDKATIERIEEDWNAFQAVLQSFNRED